MHPDSTQTDSNRLVKIDSNRLESCIDVDKWSAEDCRWYLRTAGVYGQYAPAGCAVLVSRVRTRLASLQLSELWPVDPRD